MSHFGVVFPDQSNSLIESNFWIGLEKLPQNDPLNVQISPLDQNLLMCYLLDLYRIY